MNLVTSQFDKNDKSIQSLSARNGVLTKEIEAQKNKVQTLQAALENASSSFGEADSRTRSWQIQLNNAQADLNKMESVFIFFVAYIASKILGMSHDIAAPAGMIGASNFFELAAAVAITLFGTTSPAALATTVGVLTEVPVMLALVKAANNTKGWFKS